MYLHLLYKGGVGLPKVCCFIGHSKIWGDISQALTDAVERHITEYGVTDFLVGNYGQFDRMAAVTVKRAKAQHPGIQLYLMHSWGGAGTTLEHVQARERKGLIHIENLADKA